MRWLLVASMLLLAGCTDGEPSLLEDAEDARTKTLDAAGPGGSLARVDGTIDMDITFDGEHYDSSMDLDIRLHDGDAFSMHMIMETEGETIEATFLCTPDALIIATDFADRMESPNGAGTCLDVEGTDPLSFLGAFNGMDADGMDFSSFGLAPDLEQPYTDVRKEGDAIVATFSQSFTLQGIDMDLAGTARIVDDLVRATTTTIAGTMSQSGYSMEMDMTMASTYHYGQRAAAPEL